MRVLCVATKSPWPAIGGGRVDLRGLIDALTMAGAELRVVAPDARHSGTPPAEGLLRTVETTPRSWPWSLLAAVRHRSAVMARYEMTALTAAVEDELARFRPNVVHLQQAQLGWLLPALRRRVPCVLRQENVESDLIARLARVSWWPLSALLAREAQALARAEAAACRGAHVVAAISFHDAARLGELAPDATVRVIPASLPLAQGGVGEGLTGDPPLLCLGSFNWRPNRDGAKWLLQKVWPLLQQHLPAARLHLAGPGSATLGRGLRGVVIHGVVPDARRLYDPRAIALIPLRVGSGVRMRLLEAWAAGVPAVTTPAGCAGICTPDSLGALVADTPDAFAAEVIRLAKDPSLRERLIAAGRVILQDHQPARVAAAARACYDEAIARHRANAG
jgi:glycosyltransferase involved in cell wall biosynthesis